MFGAGSSVSELNIGLTQNIFVAFVAYCYINIGILIVNKFYVYMSVSPRTGESVVSVSLNSRRNWYHKYKKRLYLHN